MYNSQGKWVFAPKNEEEAKTAVTQCCIGFYLLTLLHAILATSALAYSEGNESGINFLFQKPNTLLHLWDLVLLACLMICVQVNRSRLTWNIFIIYFGLFSFCSFFGNGAIPVLGAATHDEVMTANHRNRWCTLLMFVLVLRILHAREIMRKSGKIA